MRVAELRGMTSSIWQPLRGPVVVGATLLVLGLKRFQLALPRPIVVDVASSFLVALGVFWFVSRSYA